MSVVLQTKNNQKPSGRRVGLMVLLALATGLSAIAVVPAASAGNCNPASSASEVSVRPRNALNGQYDQIASVEVGGNPVTPYQEQNCLSGCPGKPFFVLWNDPSAALSQDPMTYVDFCSFTLPEDQDGDFIPALYRWVTTCTLLGDGGVSCDNLPAGEPAPYYPLPDGNDGP